MKSLARYASLCLCVLVSPPLPIRAQEQPVSAATIGLDEAIPADPAVTVGELPNGLRFYIRENDEPENRAELRLVVNAGSILEEDDQQGLAHFLEHMAFNGTTHFEKQELVEYMESIGMRIGMGLNASTSFDETIYVLRVPTDSLEVLENAFLILEDWAHGLAFEPEEIDRERGVIVEEWRLGRGAAARMRDAQFPVLFEGSRYAERLPIGDMDVVQNFEHETLIQFYRDWYRPDLMAVIAVGDFDGHHVEELIRDHFSRLAVPENPKPRSISPVPDHEETLFAITTDEEAPISSVSLYFKQPIQEQGTVRAYRQEIVEGFFNSMLNQRLSELAQEAEPPFLSARSSQGNLTRSKGAYILSATVDDDGIVQGLEAILTEAERVAQHGFTEAELGRAKENALRSMERSYESRDTRSSSSFVGGFIGNFLQGSQIGDIGFRYELYQRFVPEITVEEVNRLARDWITEENRVILVNAPDKEDLAVPTEGELSSIIEAVNARELEPYTEDLADEPLLATLPEPGTIVVERTVDTVGVTEWELSNGALVVLKPTDFTDDQIIFQAFSPGGSSLVDDGDYLPVSSAGSIINGSGVGPFDPIDLGKKLTGKVASANASITELEEGLSGSASPQDLETMFQLAYMRFTDPRADTTVLVSNQNRMLALLENYRANPMAVFSDTLQATMTQGHPRSPLISEEVIMATDLEASLELYRDRFADASDFTFIFVGDLDVEAMRPLVETYIASLPSLNRVERWRDVGPTPPKGVIEKAVYKGMEPQSQSVFIFTGDFQDSRTNRNDFSAMNTVLQTKLRERIREELGGTYGVGVSGSTDWRPTGEYSIAIQFGSDPERVEELKEVIFQEIQLLQTLGPDAEDLANSIEARRRSRETNLESNSYWATQLAEMYRRGQDLSYFWDFEASLEEVTPESVRAAAQRYFDLENYVRVTLYPESMKGGGSSAPTSS
ncbi:MAG: insulinase family protein [Gemmatimonadota bacterium]|jgi:zinc protease